MIANEIKNINSGKTELRKFGVTMGIAIAIIGCIPLIGGEGLNPYIFMISALFFLLAFTWPRSLFVIHKIWMALAIIMGWIVTRIILSILFYTIMTPLNLLSRLFGKHFLDIGFDSSAESYWIPKKEINAERDVYERQF